MHPTILYPLSHEEFNIISYVLNDNQKNIQKLQMDTLTVRYPTKKHYKYSYNTSRRSLLPPIAFSLLMHA